MVKAADIAADAQAARKAVNGKGAKAQAGNRVFACPSQSGNTCLQGGQKGSRSCGRPFILPSSMELSGNPRIAGKHLSFKIFAVSIIDTFSVNLYHARKIQMGESKRGSRFIYDMVDFP